MDYYNRFAGNKCCLRDVAERFGVGLGTCFKQHMRVMNFLYDIAPSVIAMPNNEESKEECAEKFREVCFHINKLSLYS